jgi:hypothetical protein
MAEKLDVYKELYSKSSVQETRNRMVSMEFGSLAPDKFDNFSQISNKYPNISKDLVMAMVKQGLNANTPGIGSIVSADGITKLKNDMMNVDKIKKTVASDRGVVGQIGNALNNTVYAGAKTTTRVGFAAIRSIYDLATVTARDISTGRVPMSDPLNTLKSTTLGSLVTDVVNGGGVDTGSGFFVDPRSKVGKDQAKAMQAYGKINGDSFTIGRWAAKSMAQDPDTTAYKLISGSIDAVLNIGLDPTIWVGPGSVGKIIQTGKQASALKLAAQPFTEATQKAALLEKQAALRTDRKELYKLGKKEAAKQYKRIDTSLHKTSMEIAELEKKSNAGIVRATKELLNTEKTIMYPSGNAAADKAVEKTLSVNSVADWFTGHEKVRNGELTRAIDTLSAETKNTGGFFGGNVVFMDEVPELNKISVAAHGMSEYVVTARGGEKLNLLDLGNNFAKATPKEVAEEASRRAAFIDELDGLTSIAKDTQEKQILQELVGSLKQDSANLEGFHGSLFSVGDEVVQAESLGSLIGKVAKYNNPEVLNKVYLSVKAVWGDVDGFTNVRSIYGGTGGVAIANMKKIGAKSAEVAVAAAEVADPTNLGPNLAKLLSSVKGKEEMIARRQNELEDAVLRGNEVDDRLNYIYSLRQAANKDPEILKELINDPDYKGLKKILNIESQVAEKSAGIEALRVEAGLVDGFSGNVTKDFDKHLKFLLGKRFEIVAEVVAKETDPVRVHTLFGGKLDLELTQALTDASTSEDVLKVLLNNVGGETMDPRTVRDAISTGLKLQASPMARMVDPANLKVVKFVEKVDRVFGRNYVRGSVLSLGNGTELLNGVADWVSSAGIKQAIGSRRQEVLIAEIQRDIFKATTNQERGAAVVNGVAKIVDSIGTDLALDTKLIDELKAVTKISGKERATQNAYSLNRSITDSVPHITVTNGESIAIDKALMEWQAVQDFLFLPDTRAIYKAVGNYKANAVFNKARAGKVLLEEFGDFWRTAQLVGRFAYVTRNIAEMQMRQMLSGHNSLFNNPLGFIATVVANPEGGVFSKFLAKGAKYQYDAGGNAFKTQQAEADLGDASVNFRSWWNRLNSAGDTRSNRRSQIFNQYKVVGSDHPEFSEGLAYTVNNFVSDKFMPAIINLKDSSPEAQRAWLEGIAKDFDNKNNPLRNFAASIFTTNPGLRQIYLKDATESGPGIVKDNLNIDDILIHLFDSSQSDTVISQINAVAGTGPKASMIFDLIRDGEITVTRGNKLVKIKAPYSTGGKTVEELNVLEKEFIKKMKDEFKPEDLTGSTVFVKNQEVVFGQLDKSFTQFVDKFFELAAYAESKLNFGPEFQMAYWDYAAGYAPLLKTEDLLQFRANANKSLAPITKNGKKAFGRRSPVLREINKEIAKREKNPSYVGGTASIKTIDTMASREASKYVKGLFYDAGQQKQYANAVRLIFPFAQAHYNTLSKWAELSKNPAPAIKFAKAFDALNKQGSNVLYDISGVTYDPEQGFFYQDTPNGPKKFKTPFAGTVLGAMASAVSGVDGAKQALQMTSPVQSLNLAFGQVNPGLPGIGPVAQGLFAATGRSTAFGPANDILRDIITPFGKPKGISDFVFPAWLRKTVAYRMGDEATVQRGVKDWAAYLASTGNYGDNPMASDAERNRMFKDAEALSREVGFFGALFQSISAATPQDEVLAKIKDPTNKLNFMTMTMLYDHWQKISDQNPGDYGKAVSVFADTYGIENLLVTLGSTTPGVRGTDDAWTWLNNNPGSVAKYAKAPGDIIPYFFPGGEYSLKYYNWQKSTGARRALSTTELANEAESRVYNMMKSQIANEQIAGGYGQIWYTEQIAKLDQTFGDSKPASTITTGTVNEKIASVKNALEDPAFKQSPVYNETAQFYSKYRDFQDILNKAKVSNYAELTSKGGLATLMRNELRSLAEELMLQNQSFSRMYYGVFAGQLEG